jgi:magnesium and cobalt exporter, CNNM family
MVITYSVMLVFLILLSGFFSAAETGLMSINRYRLRHKARMQKRSALLILKLLKRPDRLLGMILIGNCVANIFASSLATLLAIHFMGNDGVVLFAVVLTLIILVFAEVAPKTVAALYSEKVARMVAYPVLILLKLFYPLVWFINTLSNGLLYLMHVKVSSQVSEPLSREELRSVVFEGTGKVPHQYQRMLLGILDLNKVTVDDVMIPRHEIMGIDLKSSWEQIQQQIVQSKHDWLPVYQENINKITGVLHVRDVLQTALNNQFNEEQLLKVLREPYFVPEGTLLNIQLHHFQNTNKRMAVIVDEYGEIKGLLTLKDILEEVLGEFTSSVNSASKLIGIQPDGSYLANGAITVRELNRVTSHHLPTGGPRTLSGLIIEYLESIPRVGTCVLIGDYPIEILEVKDNRIKLARIFPRLKGKNSHSR